MSVDVRSARHEELARFLRARRERLTPEECGLPTFKSRKRVPGLRREDVSLIAGISTAYYTWIEQGRVFDISTEILGAIAGALRFSDAETNYLFLLAGKAEPKPPSSETTTAWSVALLQALDPTLPILILTPWLEVVEANAVADDLLAIPKGTNLVRWFIEQAHEELVRCLNPEDVVTALTVLLRCNHAHDFDNPSFAQAITVMRTEGRLFADVWSRYDVDPVPIFPVEFEHVREGRKFFRALVLGAPGTSQYNVVLMTRATRASERRRDVREPTASEQRLLRSS